MDRRLTDTISLSVATGQNRFRMNRGSFSYRQILYRKIDLKRTEAKETPSGYSIGFENSRLGLRYRLVLTDVPGGITTVRLEDDAPEASEKFNRYLITIPAYKDEAIYGCGETYSRFDLKGEKVRIFVAEHQNTKRISGKIIREKFTGPKPEKTLRLSRYESYCSIPVYTSSRKYFVFCEVDSYCRFDFTKPDTTTIYTQQPPVLYIAQADDFTSLSEKLTSITGRSPSLPEWVNDGAILAIQGGTEKVLEKVKKFRDAGGAVCGVWSQDWCGCRVTGFGYQVMWNWQWDKNLYPDLDRCIRELKEQGIRFLGYINPFLALEGDLYKYAQKKGYCVKDRKGKDYLVKITTFPAAMVDLTNPEAWEWYKDIIKTNMIDLGMGGWMADFGEYLPVDCVLYSGEDPYYIHDNWPEMWARLNMEALEEKGAEKDVFFFTRAAYTRSMGYTPMMWTGDQHVDWSMDDGLPSVITASLSLAMSGFGISHWDAGGYTTIMHMTRSEELLLRWLEASAFSPLLRTHEGNQPSRNVQFDSTQALVSQTVKMSRIHRNLRDYLRSLSELNCIKGTPVIRPLFYHYPGDETLRDMDTEYMLGRDMLVAPVITKGAVSKQVYLPDDRWVHLFTEKEYTKGWHDIDAPIGTPPVFIRKDSPVFEELMSIVRTE